VKFEQIEQPYLIAEIGINHNGDMQIAKRLMDAAFACQWDCVKFQKRNPDVCVPEAQKGLMRDTPWGRMTYLEYKKRIEFGQEAYDQIDAYCKLKPLDWSASVWDMDSLSFLVERYDVPFLKIASAQISDLKLVEAVAKTGKPVIMSTGMSTIEEVDQGVNVLMKHSSNYLLMHTNSAYPTPDNEINLRIMETLKERYSCPIGYSGHEYGVEPSVIAACLGAKVIERHITLDHNMWGTDQAASLEIDGMDKLRRRVSRVRSYLGTNEKRITESELPIREKLKKVY
jgi:N-acetylneuraminate synthase